MNFFEVINLWGMIFAVLLALPYVLLRRKHPVSKSDYPNQALYLLDRIGRFGSLLLMSFHTGILEQGFTEPKALMQRFWLIVTAALIALDWLLWLLFFKRERRALARLIAAVSAAAVIFSGILQVNTLLLSFGVTYLIGELYIIHIRFNRRGE